MKSIFKYVTMAVFGGTLCVALAMPAEAQRRGTGGGGGGGGGFSRGGGGGAPSGGGFSRGGGFSSPAPRSNGDFSSGRRGVPGGGFNRDMSTRQQPNAVSPRGNNGFADARRGTFNGRQQNGLSPRANNNFFGNGNIARRGTNSPNLTTGRGGFYRGGRYYPGRVTYGNRGFGNRFYGRAYGPWGNYGGYYFNRGFYSSLYYPRLGFSLGVLPYGYYPFYWGGSQFYLSGGLFYQYNNNQYTVVEPPLGAAITDLPDGAESIVINGEQYYELNGVYYLPTQKDDGSVVYEVVGKDGQLDTSNMSDMPAPTIAEARVGEIVTELPPDTRKVTLNGDTFLVSPDQYYYQELPSDNGTKTYKVVAVPIIEPVN